MFLPCESFDRVIYRKYERVNDTKIFINISLTLRRSSQTKASLPFLGYQEKDIHTQRARRRLTEEKKKNENTWYLCVRRCDYESHVYAMSSRIENLFASLLLKSVSIIPIFCRCSMHVICLSRNAFN